MKIYKIAQGIPDTSEQSAKDSMQQASEEYVRMRPVKVIFDDGDVIETNINGTKSDVEKYYLENDFTKSDEVTTHRGVQVIFLGE
jgi:hypothetical protein